MENIQNTLLFLCLIIITTTIIIILILPPETPKNPKSPKVNTRRLLRVNDLDQMLCMRKTYATPSFNSALFCITAGNY